MRALVIAGIVGGATAVTACAHAEPRLAGAVSVASQQPMSHAIGDEAISPGTGPHPASQSTPQPPASRPTVEQLQQALRQVLEHPALAAARVSVLVDEAAREPAPAEGVDEARASMPVGPDPSMPVGPDPVVLSAASSQPGARVVPPPPPPPQQQQPSVASRPATPTKGVSLPEGASLSATPRSIDAASLASSTSYPLFAHAAAVQRVPASNAKLLTSAAACLALTSRHRFVTEVGQRGGRIYLRGNGDPVLRRSDLVRLAATVKARGVRSVRGITVDDSALDRRQLAPGFESFSEGSHYRPTSSALNVDGNAIVIKVSAPKDRRHPRVDVSPPSDYVKVRKLVRFAPRSGRRTSRAVARRPRVSVQMRRRGSIMWLTISGTIDRDAPPFSTRRAVYDPALNVGWAFRRALVNAGVAVSGVVGRGSWPRGTVVLARRFRPLGEVLQRTNTHSDNLAAENLVRAMGSLAAADQAVAAEAAPARRGRGARQLRAPGGSWERGLKRLERELAVLGIEGFRLGNGSGLHRESRVSAQLLVRLLQRIHGAQRLRRMLLPTLAVAGRSGTLARRLRGTVAEGVVWAKTGTLGNALALSGYVDPEGPAPLAFSVLINGRAGRAAREQIDRIALLLARYVQGLPLDVAAAGRDASSDDTDGDRAEEPAPDASDGDEEEPAPDASDGDEEEPAPDASDGDEEEPAPDASEERAAGEFLPAVRGAQTVAELARQRGLLP